jgi:DNA-binding NarL/FixJ family response regulator
MPEMTGTDLTQQFHLVRPDLPVILSTGYMATLTPENTKAWGIAGVLLKPHTMHSLATAVQEALNPQHPG